MSIRAAYRESLSHQGHVHDHAQQLVVDKLADLQTRLEQQRKPLQRLWRALRIGAEDPGVPGLYLWGGVGRGKTFLMDLFF
ncbi:MAG: AFG1/ZapE family ATPase, partial [Woeseiaceae bacterium]